LSLLWHDAAPHFAQAALSQAESPEAARQAPQTPDAKGVTDRPERGQQAPHLYNHRLVRLPRSYQSPAQAPVNASALAPAPEGQPPGVEQVSGTAPRRAADVGTLVHRYLQLMAEDGLEHWPLPRLRELQPAMALWLGQQGHAPTEAQAAAAEVVAHLVTTLESADGRWVLGPHDQAVCERSYTTVSDGVMQTHVIDRMFRVDGVRWIVDYKTTAALSGDAAAPLQAHTEQLARYRQLFADEADVRTAVYFTAQGRLVAL
jgi:ATP-dependent exoDNAse (exonuclease V) beta subunit